MTGKECQWGNKKRTADVRWPGRDLPMTTLHRQRSKSFFLPSGVSEIKLKYRGVESGKLDSGIFRRKLPVDPGAAVISPECPRTHLTNKAGCIRERFGKSLPAHDTDLDFCHIKPASMLRCEMPFKAFC